MTHSLASNNQRVNGALRRRGMSLLETVTVMGANVVLVTAALSLLMTYIRADNQMAARDDRMLQLAPLIKQVRDDLRGAERANYNEQTLTLQMLDGNQITYAERDGAWQRQISADNPSEDVVGSYRLPQGSKLVMVPADAASGDVVRVDWSMPPEVSLPHRLDPPVEELVVTVGRDGRLLHP